VFLRLFRLSAAFAALAAVAPAQNGVMAGRMEGDLYVSPTGEFKIPAPILPELGGSISDTENVVTFSDSYDTHISIACFPQDAVQKWELETRGLRDYLLYFFTSFVLADFQGRFPGAGIESARFLPGLLDGAMITYALLPGGSYFEGKNSVLGAPVENPVTAKRGTLLFVRNRYIYVISTELAERATQRSTYSRTVEQEDRLLSERLTTLANRLIFTGSKTRSP
jgi:hypothetical protein